MHIDYRQMKQSLVKVDNIYAEDLFEWFYTNVMDSGGDGCGTIVCKNYKEVADYFKEWHSVKYPDTHKWFHPKDEYRNIVNFHDDNENFMFTNEFLSDNCYGDYVFIVEGDCKFAYEPPHSDKKIIGIERNNKSEI